ncbi:MAG: branched-chain amino acid ABC transporter permease [Betaproteobacteria bacterium]|nr:branched-chain amino acid ABC transporter permease [Betaproteobacteria bacterium]
MIAILIDGIVQGLQLSLMAVGITLIYGLGGVLNLAHGQFAVVGGIAAALCLEAGVNPLVACAIGILSAGAFGLAVDRTLLLPAYRSAGEERLLLGLLITLGLSFVVNGYLDYKFPNISLTLKLPTPSFEVGGITVRTASALAASIAIVAFVLLFAFLKGTLLGKVIRSIIQNEVGAGLCGINPGRIRTLIVTLSAMMAGLGGVVQGLFSSLGTEMGNELTSFALIVAVVGGVRSVNGTLAAGVLLGIVNAFASYYVGAYLTLIILLGTAVFTILLRPEGLFASRT